jgi:ABC-2 type transport system permease protein
MTAFVHHFAFEFKTGLRNSTLLLMNYLFPMIFYAMMGLVMTEINPMFADTMIPAMVIFATLASTTLGLPGPLVESREAGIFRSFKINGVPAASILLIPAITTVFHVLIVAITTVFHVLIVATIIVVTGGPLFDGAVPTRWGAFAGVTLLTALCCAGFGALIGVVAEGSRGTVLLSQLIFLPSMLLGGLMMPLDFMPESVRPISFLLPATHSMEAFLGLAYGQETVIDPLVAVIVLLSSGLLAFGLAIYLFNWDSRNSARRGHPLMGLLAVVPYVIAAVTLI